MRPTFIACTARSGSTLLRWLIDSHPDVSCPAETDLALVVAAFERSVQAMSGPDDRGAIVAGRRAAEVLIDDHLQRARPRHFCDKSMSNALNLDLLARAWMSAHFIFLHRHVMDFVASALQAQPFGLTDYGFPAYAARCPGDDVGALVRYWLERTNAMLAFERITGHKSVRLRYEDLVTGPTAALEPVWKLIGTEPADAWDAFTVDHGAHGCGDHQIWYTNHVSADSIGWGARIAPGRVAGALRREVNAALVELDYPQIDDAWGAGGPLETDQVRIVSGHQVVQSAFFACGGTIAVEAAIVDDIVAGRVNAGAALRSREVRYFGPPLSGYGEERSVMSQIPTALMGMV